MRHPESETLRCFAQNNSSRKRHAGLEKYLNQQKNHPDQYTRVPRYLTPKPVNSKMRDQDGLAMDPEDLVKYPLI